jgi:tetratricopeptide (TPR) repeat protein
MWVALLALMLQAADTGAASARLFADGVKALDEKRYDAAVESFHKAADADPKDYAARFQLALAYSLLGQNAEAIPQYKAALDLKPGLYEAEINLGICLVRTKDFDAALPYLRSAAQHKPSEFQPAFYLAAALLEKQQWAEAEAAYNTAVSLNPASAAAQLGLGQALMHQGRLADAATHFRKAAAIDPAYGNDLLQLGPLYEQNHQPTEAVAIYREFPHDPAALERMGALLLDLGRTEEALPALEQAVAASPTTANRLALAQAFLSVKQPAKAEPLIKQAVAAEPRNYEIRMFYGGMLRDQHRYAESAPEYMAAAQLKPDSAAPWSNLAAVLVLAEQYREAIAALDHVRALGAENSGHYYFRAISFDHLHQFKDALANYNKFLETSQGKNPDEEFIARQRVRIIQNELKR